MMAPLFTLPSPEKCALKQVLLILFLAPIVIFVLRTALLAIDSAFANDDFPEALAIKVELLPWLFPLHMVCGGLALVLIPATYLLRGLPRWHRRIGRWTALMVVSAGLTAFPVALIAPVTAVSALGFTAQAMVWIGFLAKGLWHIRRGEAARHRAAMLLMAATTSGAIFFRVYLALWAVFAHEQLYERFYAANAWLAWILPVAITAWLLKRSETGKAVAPMAKRTGI